MIPYEMGREAYKKNPGRRDGLISFRPFGINPFHLGSQEYEDWDRGYVDEHEKTCNEAIK